MGQLSIKVWDHRLGLVDYVYDVGFILEEI